MNKDKLFDPIVFGSIVLILVSGIGFILFCLHYTWTTPEIHHDYYWSNNGQWGLYCSDTGKQVSWVDARYDGTFEAYEGARDLGFYIDVAHAKMALEKAVEKDKSCSNEDRDDE